MINFIVTAVLAILVAVFGLLRTVWTGFAYFSLVALVAICLYWLFVLIKTYIYDFHKDKPHKVHKLLILFSLYMQHHNFYFLN